MPAGVPNNADDDNDATRFAFNLLILVWLPSLNCASLGWFAPWLHQRSTRAHLMLPQQHFGFLPAHFAIARPVPLCTSSAPLHWPCAHKQIRSARRPSSMNYINTPIINQPPTQKASIDQKPSFAQYTHKHRYARQCGNMQNFRASTSYFIYSDCLLSTCVRHISSALSGAMQRRQRWG